MRKRLKDSREVYHYWANQVQSEGYCGNCRFDGSDAYSYRAVIARLYEFEGKKVAVIATRRWSMTTGKHQSYVRSSIPEGMEKVYVYDATWPIPDALNQARQEIAEYMDLAYRARQRKDSYLAKAANVATNFNRYAQIRGSDVRIDTSNLGDVRRIIEEEEQAQAERDRQHQELLRKEYEKKIVEWRAGGDHNLWWLNDRLLRLSKDRTMVETSGGAEIPVKDALAFWEMLPRIQSALARSGEREYRFIHPSQETRMGVYRLNSVSIDGDIVVGCHKIKFAEIQSIARQLGLIEATKEAA